MSPVTLLTSPGQGMEPSPPGRAALTGQELYVIDIYQYIPPKYCMCKTFIKGNADLPYGTSYLILKVSQLLSLPVQA